jgi:hypothetical protein
LVTRVCGGVYNPIQFGHANKGVANEH